MKTCCDCHEELLVTEFHRNQDICKKCRAKRDKGRIRSNSRDPKRNANEAARARKRRWLAKNYDPKKMKARRAVRAAVKAGVLIPPETCSVCGGTAKRRDGVRAIQAHHHFGYERQLDVVWLCPPCHRKEDHPAAKDSHE